jgi:hypothetical protein
LWASIATLAHAAGYFARRPEGENGTWHPTLLEPAQRQLSRGVDLRVAVERLGHRRRVSPGPDEDVGRVDRRHLDGDEIVPRTRNRQFADLYRFRGPGSARNAAHLVVSMYLQGVR